MNIEDRDEDAKLADSELEAADTEEAMAMILRRREIEALNMQQAEALLDMGIVIPPSMIESAPFIVMLDMLFGPEGSEKREQYKLNVEKHLQDKVFGYAYEHRNEIAAQITAEQRRRSLVIPGQGQVPVSPLSGN